MLKLNSTTTSEQWESENIKPIAFDLKAVKEKTISNPTWLHFGAGNIFRGFIANAQQKLLNEGIEDKGIIAIEAFDEEIIEKIYEPFDNLTLLVSLEENGNFNKNIVGSIVHSLCYSKGKEEVESYFTNPTLQMVSFTITEKGYNGPLINEITNLLYKRFSLGNYPVAMVSMDNCSHNGDLLKKAVFAVVEKMEILNKSDFVNYLNNSVTFPLTMIDKITPRPSEDVLKNLNVQDMDVVITNKNTYIAPFVNAETFELLVIEDIFPNGRPNLEKAGIVFTDRQTVNKIETMKVTTCLNPLHTALAVTGCLLGYKLIADEMKNEILVKLIKKIGYDEGLKVVVDPKVVNPKEFIDTVINKRFSNPFIPDTPQRIATDTSQKVGIRFGVTIKSYVENSTLNPSDLVGIPLAIASWLRYLKGVDDSGNKFELSPDPMINDLISKDIKEILSDESIFGLNLYDVNLGDKIETYYNEMLEKGGVKATLKKYL